MTGPASHGEPAFPGHAVEVDEISSFPDEAWIVALSMLDQMGPARLAALLDQCEPREAWQAVRTAGLLRHASVDLIQSMGRNPPKVADDWRRGAGDLDVGDVWARHAAAGIGVCGRGSAAFPTCLLSDPHAPSILFSQGDPDVVQGSRVAIVGTRDCTRYGYDVARTLGAELSEAGVSIVSGLAIGIDGAAHSGALDVDGAPPIAVVGTGLDVVYPRRNLTLWRRVAEAGVIFSEYPLGSPAIAWHFPARNRLIALLADLVVVVESQEKGGSILTAGEAYRRGIDVMALPGPVTSRSSAGTNQLLSEGAHVVRDTTDVLVKLGMSEGARRTAKEHRPAPSAADQSLLEQFEWQPANFDQLILRSGLELSELALALDRLADGGWIERRGGWYERIAKSRR